METPLEILEDVVRHSTFNRYNLPCTKEPFFLFIKPSHPYENIHFYCSNGTGSAVVHTTFYEDDFNSEDKKLLYPALRGWQTREEDSSDFLSSGIRLYGFKEKIKLPEEGHSVIIKGLSDHDFAISFPKTEELKDLLKQHEKEGRIFYNLNSDLKYKLVGDHNAKTAKSLFGLTRDFENTSHGFKEFQEGLESIRRKF